MQRVQKVCLHQNLDSQASDGDFKSFAKGVPNTLTNQKKMELYNTLRKSMGMKEELETWEIAPKF